MRIGVEKINNMSTMDSLIDRYDRVTSDICNRKNVSDMEVKYIKKNSMLIVNIRYYSYDAVYDKTTEHKYTEANDLNKGTVTIIYGELFETEYHINNYIKDNFLVGC